MKIGGTCDAGEGQARDISAGHMWLDGASEPMEFDPSRSSPSSAAHAYMSTLQAIAKRRKRLTNFQFSGDASARRVFTIAVSAKIIENSAATKAKETAADSAFQKPATMRITAARTSGPWHQQRESKVAIASGSNSRLRSHDHKRSTAHKRVRVKQGQAGASRGALGWYPGFHAYRHKRVG